MSEHQRFNLDDAVNEPRQGIDANWTRGRRIGVGALCVLIAGAAIGGGYYAWSSSRPIDLPRSAHDAVRVMASERFDRLPADRRAQYAEEDGSFDVGDAPTAVMGSRQPHSDRARR